MLLPGQQKKKKFKKKLVLRYNLYMAHSYPYFISGKGFLNAIATQSTLKIIQTHKPELSHN